VLLSQLPCLSGMRTDALRHTYWLAAAVRTLSMCLLLKQVPRQRLIQVDLLDKLPLGTADLQVPAEGMTVPHIRCA
jgi:hypothetical protein